MGWRLRGGGRIALVRWVSVWRVVQGGLHVQVIRGPKVMLEAEKLLPQSTDAYIALPLMNYAALSS